MFVRRLEVKMSRIISFDDAVSRQKFARTNRKPLEKTWNYQDTVRAVRSFFGGMTVSAIAARERVGLNFIEGLIRDHSRPEYPAFPIAARLRRVS